MTTSKKARATATPMVGVGQQYLTFALGQEVFAMNIANVREIIQYGPMTTVPLMPSFVRGMINLRGSVVPVIDLQARFGRGAAAIGKKSCNVIFDATRGGERVEPTRASFLGGQLGVGAAGDQQVARSAVLRLQGNGPN